LLAAAIWLVVSPNGLYHVRQLKLEKAALDGRIAKLQQQKSDYEAKIVRLSTDSSIVEREIRDQLKYVRNDETVFVVPEATPGGGP
jgi:cell division protein FtsB